MTHTITWDHSDCEHDPDPDEHWCSPSRGDVVCDDLTCEQRKLPDCPTADPFVDDESWYVCRDCSEESDVATPHQNPGEPHTSRGYLIKMSDHCNAAAWLSDDWDLGEYVDLHIDGPVEVEWQGYNYSISYLDPAPRNAVG